MGHPVMWMGWLISRLDRGLNRETDSSARRKFAGVLSLLAIGLASGLTGLAVQAFCAHIPFGALPLAFIASSLLAQNSLGAHVSRVADGLERDGLEAGRRAVAMIVGRDPDALDEAGVCRAAIESLAENFSDGVVAPAFWLLVAGLPGAAIYKAVNTADSMIGHRSPRYLAFGWAAARFDDLINLPASRLTAMLLVGAAALTPGADAAGAWRAVWRDAGKHRSPNAGWPEAAMAGALGLSLAGGRVYGGVQVDDAEMGAGGRREATTADIRRALKLYWFADALLISLWGAMALAVIWRGG